MTALGNARTEQASTKEEYDAHLATTRDMKNHLQQLSMRSSELSHQIRWLRESMRVLEFRILLIRDPKVIGLPWFYRASAEVVFKKSGDIHIYFGGVKGIEDSSKDGHAHYIVRKRKDGSYQRTYERKPSSLLPAILASIYDLFFWAGRPGITRAVTKD